MIRVLLIDVDGVLIDGEPFTTKLESDHGISHEMVQPFFHNIFETSITGQADLVDIIQPYLTGWGWNGTAQDFISYWFKAEHEVNQPLVNYMQELRAKGVACYLATNQEHRRADYILNQIGFNELADGIFYSAEFGVAKPAQGFFEKVIADLSDISLDTIVFWDDSLKNVEAAIAAGIQSEQYVNFAQFKHTMESVYV